MFNLSGSEIVFLLLAGLVVLGPERLPGVIRTVGKIYGDIRRAANGFEKELTETFKDPIKDITSTVKGLESGFGQIDHEPSPPMRPEMSQPMPIADNPKAQEQEQENVIDIPLSDNTQITQDSDD